MEYQRFIPEGWQENLMPINKETIDKALISGDIIEAKVIKCDSNYNLHVDLGEQIKGIIPREEIEAINIDETGFPKPNICINKVNKYVQFKVKDIDKKNVAILSRKEVGTDALNWVKNELEVGTVVHRNSKKY